MKTHTRKTWLWTAVILITFILGVGEARASHAQSADITYQCLGGNQYQVSLSFYRDCAGVAAPNSVTVNVASASCNQNFNVTLNPIPGTGIEVSPICVSMNTNCNGGNYPGVQEWIYQGVVTLPMACTDWIFSFSLCCRNTAINTISNPGGENIYVAANLNNLNFPCNNSPVFSNRPIPFVCVGQSYCFNHGAIDVDGDSLVYTLIPPATGPTSSVTYVNPYTPQQPLLSNPAMTFNSMNGDICMTPTQLEVTVMAVLVEEYRNGILVGSVMRDIQLRTITCTNNIPYVLGINNTNQYQLTACAGSAISFTIDTYDVDTLQNVTLSWNAGINGSMFVISNGPRPTGTFTWTPGQGDVGNTFCFTVTVTDDNCPYNGSQTFAFCIDVTGFTVAASATTANCNASNGSATAIPAGGNGPYTYQWLPSGGNNANANGLAAGTYTVNVTDASGCVATQTVVVPQGPAPGNLLMTSTNIACFGGNTGSATANMNGGQQPYTYLWSNNNTTPTLTNLPAGTYSVSVTTANGCISTGTVVITQPATALTVNTSISTPVSCNGGNNGTAAAVVNGGVPAYTYSWNTQPVQTTANATNLAAGSYVVTITDAGGCVITGSVTLTQPAALVSSVASSVPVSCYGNANGSATAGVSGGTGPFTYSWTTNPIQTTVSAGNLGAGNYQVVITDANGCTSTSSVQITQPNPLVVNISAVTDVSCNAGNNGTATAAASGGTGPYAFSWTSNPIQNTATAINLNAGTYFVTITDANGCGTVTTATVNEPLPLVITATGNDTVCPGQQGIVNAFTTGGTGQVSYNWNPQMGNNSTYTVYPNTLTNYIVSATDANGCVSNSDTVTIDVYQFLPGNLQVSGNTGICAGNSANIVATVTGNTGSLTWSWSNNPNWTGSGPYSVTPTTTTTYTVTVTNICGVALTGNATVIVNPLPAVTLTPQSATGCDVAALTFTDNNPNNVNCSYLWDFGDGNTATLSSTQHGYSQSGNYVVSVVVTSAFGCTSTANTTVSIVVIPSSEALFQPSLSEVSVFEPTITFNDMSNHTTGWYWDFGDGNFSTQVSPTHTYADKGTYQVRLITTNNGMCPDTSELSVEVVPEFTIYIPNAFTPNGDGKNETFNVYGQEISEFRMYIFDRWGNQVFSTDKQDEGWNGHANNGSDAAQQDVYVYRVDVIDFSGRKHRYDGHVSLLK